MLKRYAAERARMVQSLIVETTGRYVGVFFVMNEEIFAPHSAVIAVTEYSLVTTRAARRAIHQQMTDAPYWHMIL